MTALIVVDMQYDFVSPNGALYVNGAQEIVEPISQLIKKEIWDIVIFTQDWHTFDHISFNVYPRHCIQNSKGAEIVSNLKRFDNITQTTIKKGFDPNVDSLSAFANEQGKSTGLHELLKDRNIQNIVIVGVALELCVYYTANSPFAKSFRVFILKDFTRPLNKDNAKIALKNLNSNVIVIT